jgi:hypothetical protein
MQAFVAAATWRRNRKAGIESGTTMLNSKRCDWKIDNGSSIKGSPSREKGKKRSSLARPGREASLFECLPPLRREFFYDVLYMSGSCGCQLIMHEVLAAIRNRFMLK